MLNESVDCFGIPIAKKNISICESCVISEAVEANDAMLAFPVTINGDDKKSDGVPYHITIRWSKIEDEKKLVEDVTSALQGLDLTPPRISHIKTEILRGPNGDKEFFALVAENVPANILKIKKAIDPIFGEDKFPEYKMHITVDKDLWDRVEKEKLSAGDLRIEVGNLELSRGNRLLKKFNSGVAADVDDFGIPKENEHE